MWQVGLGRQHNRRLERNIKSQPAKHTEPQPSLKLITADHRLTELKVAQALRASDCLPSAI